MVRNAQLHLRISRDDLSRIKTLAKGIGLSCSEYIRQIGLTLRPKSQATQFAYASIREAVSLINNGEISEARTTLLECLKSLDKIEGEAS